jgi:hypothetical protein
MRVNAMLVQTSEHTREGTVVIDFLTKGARRSLVAHRAYWVYFNTAR